MEIRLSNNADKFLTKQYKGDPNGIHLVRLFIDEKLAQATNPTALPNCKKMQGCANSSRSDFLGSASAHFLDRPSILSLSLASHNPKNSSAILEFAFCKLQNLAPDSTFFV